jgi:hypothetical protein
VKRLKITVLSLDGKVTVYEADKFITEGVQWRMNRNADIILLPMVNVRHLEIEENP